MPRRPWTIRILFLIYLISPLGIIFFNAWFNMIPFTGPAGILLRLQAADWIILSLYWINAAAVFTVRKPGWWVFLASSGVLIGYNVWSYLENPLQPFPALLLYNALLFIGAALLFRREVIAPYFNPRLRWWESEPRYELEFYAVLYAGAGEDGVSGDSVPVLLTAPVRDISAGGCFLSTEEDLPSGTELPMELHLRNVSLRLQARTVRRAETPLPGWGLKFTEMKKSEQLGLKVILSSLQELAGTGGIMDDRRAEPRLYLAQWVFWREQSAERAGRILNVSKSGCCIEHPGEGFAAAEDVLLRFLDFSERLAIPSTKIWQRKDGVATVTGLRFRVGSGETKRLLKQFIYYCRLAGSRRRIDGQKVDEALVRASLAMTPFAGIYRRLSADGENGPDGAKR